MCVLCVYLCCACLISVCTYNVCESCGCGHAHSCALIVWFVCVLHLMFDIVFDRGTCVVCNGSCVCSYVCLNLFYVNCLCASFVL